MADSSTALNRSESALHLQREKFRERAENGCGITSKNDLLQIELRKVCVNLF